eukprot:TRINITY_DN1084_c1_g1_i4.p1 TRINITY_DN1084_c1_g1~~TRINITY_DN1084_c1_g1_i4.p1  ORF type:complete len:260 (+),score=79.17 TRINITY_DN1084_c1_g1_i4:16-795(+)
MEWNNSMYEFTEYKSDKNYNEWIENIKGDYSLLSGGDISFKIVYKHLDAEAKRKVKQVRLIEESRGIKIDREDNEAMLELFKRSLGETTKDNNVINAIIDLINCKQTYRNRRTPILTYALKHKEIVERITELRPQITVQELYNLIFIAGMDDSRFRNEFIQEKIVNYGKQRKRDIEELTKNLQELVVNKVVKQELENEEKNNNNNNNEDKSGEKVENKEEVKEMKVMDIEIRNLNVFKKDKIESKENAVIIANEFNKDI